MAVERHLFSPASLSRRRLLGGTFAIAAAVIFGVRRAAAAQEQDVTELLAAASQQLAEVQSMHFTLDVEGETLIDDSGAIRLENAEGDMARPDKVVVEFRVSILGAGSVSIRMITIGDTSWTTDLITGNWGDAPPEFGYNPIVLYDNQDGLGPVMGKLENATIAGTEEVNERQAYLVTGTVDSAIINTLTAGTMGGDEVAVQLWIDEETHDILRVILEEGEVEGKDEPAVWTLNLSNFNQEVSIEPPS
ncbi:MAG TPA: LppX_LprAFG lipoprotein [Thermomicrobiales bacterium]|nr:LppX_LprAFG lipoprotein [Thermomicrobiales bacterium]